MKDDVFGKLHITLADGVYVDTLNIMPRLQNQIRSLAAFDNPVYYKNKRLGYSNYYNFSSVYMGKDKDGYIVLPRGLLDKLTFACDKSSIPYDISDQREKGKPIRVSFNGDLRLQQSLAAEQLLAFDNGVLSAATAFGKTVVCSYLIAKRKVNTLILLQNKELQQQLLDCMVDMLIKSREEWEKLRNDTIKSVIKHHTSSEAKRKSEIKDQKYAPFREYFKQIQQEKYESALLNGSKLTANSFVDWFLENKANDIQIPYIEQNQKNKLRQLAQANNREFKKLLHDKA